MRNRNLLTIFMGVALALFLASQVLAQAPIDGWDKAKFGMSVEEVKETYREEIEELKKTSPELVNEWYREEQAYYELSFIGRVLKGFLGVVVFCFIDNKLFEIEVFFSKNREKGGIRGERRFWLTSLEVENFLKRKYGAPIEEERIGGRKILEWRDVEGNGLSLMVNFEHGDKFQGYFKSYDKRDFTVYAENPDYSFEVAYFHKGLTEKWERKFAEKETEKKMEIDSF